MVGLGHLNYLCVWGGEHFLNTPHPVHGLGRKVVVVVVVVFLMESCWNTDSPSQGRTLLRGSKGIHQWLFLFFEELAEELCFQCCGLVERLLHLRCKPGTVSVVVSCES